MSALSRWLNKLKSVGRTGSTYDGLDFIADDRLRRDERFLQFLSFGFVLDDRRSTEAMVRLVAAKKAAPDIFKSGWDKATPDERFGAMDKVLNEVIQDEIAAVGSRDIVLGVSGGFDSRLILHYLRRNGISPTTYTFTRNYDADCIRALAKRIPLVQFPLTGAWRFDDFYSHANREQDIVFMSRTAAATEIARAFPNRAEFHGFVGGTISGSHVKVPESPKWDAAKNRFLEKNNPIKLAHIAGGVDLLPGKSLLPADAIAFDDQLNFAYRQELRIQPRRTESDQAYRLPYADPRWMGIWLNRTAEERHQQKLYIAFIRWLNAPEMFDVSMSSDMTGFAVKQQLDATYTDRVGEKFAEHVFLSEAATRLRARQVYSNAFLDSKLAEAPTNRIARRLICCTEIVVGAGWFD